MIETRKNRVLEGSELSSIKGELEHIFVGANINWEKSMDEKFTLQENAVLAIRVTFASMEELNGSSNAPALNAPATTSLSSDELEYIEEIKACLKYDGAITPSERRLLDKLRIRLGISTERATQLEENLTPQLTEEEKEYLEDVKSCIEEGGRTISQLSNSERRLLEKSRIRLNISEERAKELEKEL